jgi:DNA-directed RNA polymerase subunit RPC12/RpoP/predicted RNA-binding Zn-ribbon protein involved in translation (DUF1610 family)
MSTATTFPQTTARNVKWPVVVMLAIGGILAFNAFAGIIGILAKSRLLDMPDPLFGVPSRYILLLVFAVQLLVASLCLFTNRRTLSLGFAAWLAINLLVYRIGLWTMGWHHPYGWLHGLMNSLNTSPFRADIAFFITIGLLIFGSLGTLCFEPLMIRAASRPIMFCPSCGGKIQFASQDLGRKIPCPLCKTTITLRKPDLLKMSCSFCKEHIEFPAHAIGQKISCPHCNMTVILKEPA